MIAENEKAPDFELKDDEGGIIKLSQFKGKKVVLYFYPKDNTPGCTKEACGLRDVYDEILEKDAIVLGISPDSESSHKRFRKRFELPFYLLVDDDHKVADMYGVWVEKNSFGKKTEGIARTTFIIDQKGVVAKVFPKVKPDKHAKEILKFLEETQSPRI